MEGIREGGRKLGHDTVHFLVSRTINSQIGLSDQFISRA